MRSRMALSKHKNETRTSLDAWNAAGAPFTSTDKGRRISVTDTHRWPGSEVKFGHAARRNRMGARDPGGGSRDPCQPRRRQAAAWQCPWQGDLADAAVHADQGRDGRIDTGAARACAS